MTPEDMASLHAACFPDRPWSAPEMADLLSKPTTRSIVHPSGQGFLLAQLIPPEGEILTLAVEPTMRRRGIARSLVNALQVQALERILLDVAANNSPAIALYLRAGFDVTGRRSGYYGAETDALLMTWSAPARSGQVR